MSEADEQGHSAEQPIPEELSGEMEQPLDAQVEQAESSNVTVLKAPEVTAEPLESLTGSGGQVRVLKADVVARLAQLSHGIEQARQQAREIVEEARREAEQIRQQAREEGRQEGVEELLPAIGKVRSKYKTIQDEAQEDTLHLAFRIARRIIGHQIEVEPEIVRDMISESLEHVRGKRNVVVYVNPEDLPYLESHREAFSKELEGAAIYFEEKESIDRGGCVIETDANRVDARLKMQLETLKKALQG